MQTTLFANNEKYAIIFSFEGKSGAIPARARRRDMHKQYSSDFKSRFLKETAIGIC